MEGKSCKEFVILNEVKDLKMKINLEIPRKLGMTEL